MVTVRAEPGPAVVRITVEDQGPGIPRELRDRVFERFYRLDTGRSAEEGGSGLGLAIVKHAVQIHGGEVCIEDVSGGTHIAFTLPAAGA
jgi:signal transduction histidine kinase